MGRREGDIAQCYADASLAKRELNWTASRDINVMCKDTWNWQQKNPKGFQSPWFYLLNESLFSVLFAVVGCKFIRVFIVMRNIYIRIIQRGDFSCLRKFSASFNHLCCDRFCCGDGWTEIIDLYGCWFMSVSMVNR